MRKIIIICLMLGTSTVLHAQSDVTASESSGVQSVESASDDSGYKVLRAINDKMSDIPDANDATVSVLKVLATAEDSLLIENEKVVLSSNMDAGVGLFKQMASGDEIFEATVAAIESLPARAEAVITIAVTFFPGSAADIIQAAVLTGTITEEDAIALALEAGADINDLNTATAAGPGVPTPAPIGIGTGAAGSGGGDTTASTN